jgi:hypothetical protein
MMVVTTLPDEEGLSVFQQRLAKKRAEDAAKQNAFIPPTPPTPPPVSSEYEELIPEAPYERSDEDKALDDAINRIDIIDAYNKWCGKSKPDAKGKREGIKISCPKPEHPDKDPSAWINLDKQTWYCAGCAEGGDAYDIAAFSFGFPVPGYKSGATFHDLRRRMAEDFGYSFISAPGIPGKILVPPSVPAPPRTDSEEEAPASTGDTSSSLAPVISITDDESFDEEIVFPTLDWRSVAEPNTFLEEYCRITSADDIPEEYNFWNGVLAVGMAIGRDVTLYDKTPVFANLFICLLGHTGDGKSRSYGHLKQLLHAALPARWDDPNDRGVHTISSPASAEVLIHNFSKPVPDPVNPKIVAYYAPVRGMIEFNELSGLTGRTSRQGNVLKPTLMEFYDASKTISTSSMSTGKKMASDPFASVFTTTQPRALRELIKQTDAHSGFLNRWVFASGQQKERMAIGGEVIDTRPAAPMLQEIHAWASRPRELGWSIEAVEAFSKFFHRVIYPAQMADETGLITRMDLLLKKLILILCANGKHEIVPLDIVDRVLKMYPYLIAAFAIPAAQIGNTLMNEVHEEIAKVCKRLTEKNALGPSQRDIMLRLKRKKYPLDLVVRVLEYMCKLGELEAKAVSKGAGRPTVRYHYVG